MLDMAYIVAPLRGAHSPETPERSGHPIMSKPPMYEKINATEATPNMGC